MKKFLLSLWSIVCFGCGKVTDCLGVTSAAKRSQIKPSKSFKTYTIEAGVHDCTEKHLKLLTVSEMTIVVRFDASAVYQTAAPVNQWDINKLWGFSDGWDHTEHSARIGWNWRGGALRLYGFAHVCGEFVEREITTIAIGEEVECCIALSGANYEFSAKGVTVSIPRATSKSITNGYQLFPYFGGNETAPKTITLQVK